MLPSQRTQFERREVVQSGGRKVTVLKPQMSPWLQDSVLQWQFWTEMDRSLFLAPHGCKPSNAC